MLRRWRQGVQRELDLLATSVDQSATPEYDYATERAFKRWRRCVITTAELQHIATELHAFALSDLWRVEDRFPHSAGVSVRVGKVTTRLYNANLLERHLEGVFNLGDIDEVRMVVGNNREALVLLTFQKRRPGVWVAIEGLVDEVPSYGDAARMILTKLERLLRGKASSPLWMYLVPRFLAPGLELHRPGDKPSLRRERLLKWASAGVGAALLAGVGWIVKRILDVVFG